MGGRSVRFPSRRLLRLQSRGDASECILAKYITIPMATCSSPELVGSCPVLLKGGCPSVCVSVRLLLLLKVGNTLHGLDLGLARCFEGFSPRRGGAAGFFFGFTLKISPTKAAPTVKIRRFMFLQQLPSASSAEPGWGFANAWDPPSFLPAMSPSQRMLRPSTGPILSPTSPHQRFKPFSPSRNQSPSAHPRAGCSPGALNVYRG